MYIVLADFLADKGSLQCVCSNCLFFFLKQIDCSRMSWNKSESETEYTNPKGVKKNNFGRDELQNNSYPERWFLER